MRRPWILAAVVALALPGVGSARPSECVQIVEDVGPACRNADGSLTVYGRDGSLLGRIHGPDPVPGPATPAAAPAPAQPACVSSTEGYAFEIIYARANDDSDGYGSKAADIRTLIASANAFVLEAATATGDHANLRVVCEAGEIAVRDEVLPTAKAQADWSSIVSDLRAKGYTDPKRKYAIFYDDPGACACGGQANYVEDQRATSENLNNGIASTPNYAVVYGYLSPRIMLHEMTHGMGAVGNGAPHSTGGHHCYDGADTMCYNDGGPKGGLYSDSTCAAEVYDCGKDDYFNARPAAGSYLASYWNIASRVNRFLEFSRPFVKSLSCPSKAGPNKPAVCSATGFDEAGTLAYSIVWGDGQTSRAPETGWASSGTSVSFSHTYANTGSYPVTVTPVDGAGETGAPLSARIDVIYDISQPTLTVSHPASGTIYNGCTTKQAVLPGARATFIQRGCAVATASDQGSGVWKVSLYVGGSHMGTKTTGPFTFEFPVSNRGTDVPVRLEAWDWAGNVTVVTVSVAVI